MADQDRIYRLLAALQAMNSELPSEIQQRIPNEILSGLASAIASGHIYEIVKSLTEVQQATEKNLFHERLELLCRQSGEKRKFKEKYQATVLQDTSDDIGVPDAVQRLDAEEEQMLKSQSNELSEFDIGVIFKMDQKVSEQQQTLEQAGVPGFFVTNNPLEIKVQMHLLHFISRLEQMESKRELE